MATSAMSKPLTAKSQIWSCGGGTQSCAIAVLIIQGRMPKPDVSVIADTGYETRATWEYMDSVLAPGLRTVGVDLVRIKSSELTPRGNAIFAYPGKSIIIPGYSTAFGSVNKLENYCTGDWKTKVIRKWLCRQGLSYSKCCRWIGFSTDEQRRWARMMQGEEYVKGLIRFPLLECGLDRRGAIKLVQDFGWPTPPRSACWMCPNHSDHEWRLIRSERPDEFRKAVELEREIHLRDPDAWLHRSCVPLDGVDFSQPEDLFARACDSGLCFV